MAEELWKGLEEMGLELYINDKVGTYSELGTGQSALIAGNFAYFGTSQSCLNTGVATFQGF